MTKVGLYTIGTYTTLESNKSQILFRTLAQGTGLPIAYSEFLFMKYPG